MMLKRGLLLTALIVAVCASAEVASADPTNAKNSLIINAMCGDTVLSVVVNGNGTFSPAHVLDSTSVFIPTAFELRFSFTPPGGTIETMPETAAKAHAPRPTVTCVIPEDLNTFMSPEGTFSISGTVTGFFTPAR